VYLYNIILSLLIVSNFFIHILNHTVVIVIAILIVILLKSNQQVSNLTFNFNFKV